MYKLSHFRGDGEYGPTAIPLVGGAEEFMEKVAAPSLMPEIVQYISTLKPKKGSIYVLVNAMGAGEYYGANVNGDYFTEASLAHAPSDWTGQPLIDRTKAKSWPYGYPTFYEASPFTHHRNKDPKRALGVVELAVWNPYMKRVELVVRVDYAKCVEFGSVGLWDKLCRGEHPDVSMGTKVPFDSCNICLDWDLYRKALDTYIPGKHKHPGMAALEFHKKLKAKNGVGIRGLSITRKDYCDHARNQMNKIFPDGRKVFVYNDFPRFFDISFVFIGADKIAKVMMHLAKSLPEEDITPDSRVSQTDQPASTTTEKTASVNRAVLKLAFGKTSQPKLGEIKKKVVPSHFAGKAVPLITRSEPDLPRDVLEALSDVPLGNALSTTAGMGMLLRPREFQRIVLTRMGRAKEADQLEDEGAVFPKVRGSLCPPMSTDGFLPELAQLLLPLLHRRSGLGPQVEHRATMIVVLPEKKLRMCPSHSSELLHKIGAAYNGYRTGALDLVAHTQQLTKSISGLEKTAALSTSSVFTPLSVYYFNQAYWDEVGQADETGLRPAWRGDAP